MDQTCSGELLAAQVRIEQSQERPTRWRHLIRRVPTGRPTGTCPAREPRQGYAPNVLSSNEDF